MNEPGSSSMGAIGGGAAAAILLVGAGFWYKKRSAAKAQKMKDLKAKEVTFHMELPMSLPGATSSTQATEVGDVIIAPA